MELAIGQDVRIFNAKSGTTQTNKQICLERADAGECTRTEILKVKVTPKQAMKAQGEVQV
jgi:hypothetical protein